MGNIPLRKKNGRRKKATHRSSPIRNQINGNQGRNATHANVLPEIAQDTFDEHPSPDFEIALRELIRDCAALRAVATRSNSPFRHRRGGCGNRFKAANQEEVTTSQSNAEKPTKQSGTNLKMEKASALAAQQSAPEESAFSGEQQTEANGFNDRHRTEHTIDEQFESREEEEAGQKFNEFLIGAMAVRRQQLGYSLDSDEDDFEDQSGTK